MLEEFGKQDFRSSLRQFLETGSRNITLCNPDSILCTVTMQYRLTAAEDILSPTDIPYVAGAEFGGGGLTCSSLSC